MAPVGPSRPPKVTGALWDIWVGAKEERRQPLPALLAPASGRTGVKRKPAPGLLTVFTLVQANPFVLWASVSSLRPNPCPTYLERCYANKRHCNELLGTWTPFSRKEASASLIKQLRHVECTMIYPNGQMLPDEMSFTSSRQRFTAGEPASRFPVFPERAGTFARRFLGAGRVPSASSYSECWVHSWPVK